MRPRQSLPVIALLSLMLITAAGAGQPVEAVSDETIAAYLNRHPDVLDKAFHDYLVNRHPEAVTEAVDVLQLRDAAAKEAALRSLVRANEVAIFHDVRDPVVGNPEADVSIVIFQDKVCPYCKGFQPVVDQLLGGDPKVRVVYKEWPIFGDSSNQAAKAVLASMNQGKFAEMNRLLLKEPAPNHAMPDRRIFDIAASLKLDVEKLKADMASPAITQLLSDNQKLAKILGFDSTPTVLINDQVVKGYMPYDELAKRVTAARGQKTASAR